MTNMIIRLVVSILLLTSAAKAFSIPITDTITVAGREWAQVDLFIGTFSEDMIRVCPAGLCGDDILNGFDMLGWTWAAADDVNALFNSYIMTDELGPGPDSYGERDSAWAPEFFTAGWRQSNFPGFAVQLHGLTRTTHTVSSKHLMGVMSDVPTPTLNDGASTDFPYGEFSPLPIVGGWFFREADAEVPVPATLWLLCAGLCALVRYRGQTIGT